MPTAPSNLSRSRSFRYPVETEERIVGGKATGLRNTKFCMEIWFPSPSNRSVKLWRFCFGAMEQLPFGTPSDFDKVSILSAFRFTNVYERRPRTIKCGDCCCWNFEFMIIQWCNDVWMIYLLVLITNFNKIPYIECTMLWTIKLQWWNSENMTIDSKRQWYAYSKSMFDAYAHWF